LTPAELGYKMPPEWAEHQRTFMEWPRKEAEWPEPFQAVLPAFAAIVKAIAGFEPVTVIAHPSLAGEAARYCGSNVEILAIEHNDSWIRDNGPTFLKNDQEELAGVNWIFNAWGGKFPSRLDNLVAPKLLQHYRVPCFNAPLVMEGGSFHVDGEGALLTTTECLLNPNRNPHLKREEIETYLKQYLNVSKIIWLKQGWFGDDTDGHIDNIACFARPGVVIVQVCSDPKDPNYEISQENLDILKDSTDAKGRPLKIIEIEQPPAEYYGNLRLTLSYLNFYFVNGGIIMPVFGNSKTDKTALKVLKKTFPKRKIVAVDGLTIARGGGNVHCLTQQMPGKNRYQGAAISN
jgi:agmatine deiminase